MDTVSNDWDILEDVDSNLEFLVQESTGTSTACLVNVAKDRAKGPQGRRLPQRKSMMPTIRSTEDSDLRQRSISLSSPNTNRIDDDDESSLTKSSDNKFLSISMEEMDRVKEEVSNQRSSSTFDITAENEDLPKPRKVMGGPRLGVNLLGQHAALTRELEMKLKVKRLPSEEDAEEVRERESSQKMDFLSTKVDLAKDTLQNLEEQVEELSHKVDAATEQSKKTKSQVGDFLLQVTVTLKEAERINEECKRALVEANRARTEYQNLVKDCKDMMAKLNAKKESKNQDK